MPLICRQSVDADTQLGIWKMDETEADLLTRHPFLQRYRAHLDTAFRNPTRRLEFLSVRALLSTLCDSDDMEIVYHDNGNPTLTDGRSISISHTKQYAAVIVSATREVGVDIERKGRNLLRIKDYYLRPDEQADTADELLRHWCAKEAVYKLYSDDHLMTREIRVVSAPDDHHRPLTAVNLKRNKTTELHTIDHPDFLLVSCSCPIDR